MASNRSRYRSGEERIVGIIGDEDTITGFLLAGVGDSSAVATKAEGGRGPAPNYFVVAPTTPLPEIEHAFTAMLQRRDMGIILVCQHIANDIQHLIREHKEPLPCVLEIPSKGLPYDSEKDEVLVKINRSLGIK